MASDVADNEELFAVIQQYQSERCGRPFCEKYGAFGTGIGWRVKQDAEGIRQPQLCLRVFVKAKQKKPSKKLDKTLPYTVRGQKFDVPVDICEAIPVRLHSAFIPSDAPTKSGFEARAPHGFRGSLGGWAWHPATDSLVMLSCWHVLGDRPATAYNSPHSVKNVARVRSGIRVVGGKTSNNVDCAFADPVPSVVERFKFLEMIPPVLASGAPVGSSGRRIPVSRYKRWDVNGGTIAGVVDAVNVEMYVEYGKRKCWFSDLFVVQAEDGAWGDGGDSGTLVFDRDPGADDTRTVLGVYMGGIDEGRNGRTRKLGVACRMDRVSEALGIQDVGGQPIFAFMDSLLDHAEPLDFLVQRRGRRQRLITRRGWSESLFEYMRKQGGRAFVGPINRQRRVVTGLLVESSRLREVAARALRPILLSGRTPQDVFDHVLTPDERAALLDLIELLRGDERLRMRGALAPYEAAVRDPDRKTVGDVLRRLDDLAPDFASMA